MKRIAYTKSEIVNIKRSLRVWEYLAKHGCDKENFYEAYPSAVKPKHKNDCHLCDSFRCAYPCDTRCPLVHRDGTTCYDYNHEFQIWYCLIRYSGIEEAKRWATKIRNRIRTAPNRIKEDP